MDAIRKLSDISLRGGAFVRQRALVPGGRMQNLCPLLCGIFLMTVRCPHFRLAAVRFAGARACRLLPSRRAW